MRSLKFGDLHTELQNKMRTVKDLTRYVDKKNSSHPNYSILLGAGASVTSGISSGGQLVEEWRREIYEQISGQDYFDGIDNKLSKVDREDNARKRAVDFLIKEQGAWYNPLKEYSSLFERKFDLPSQRRRFVEKLVDEKSPSIGYLYLVSLINKGYFNTIFTTNFDDLVNEVFYHFSNIRPYVCAHDSSIGSLSVLSNRPKIVKLHGDYLFDDIKNTLRETESLESNTKEKFIEFSKDNGLIVVGYSGQDRSIIDVLNFLLQQEEYLKNGLYWCFRKDDEITHEVRKILWKDKVYCVQIDGFDSFFGGVLNELKCELSFSDKSLDSKRGKCIQNIISDGYELAKSNSIIARHIEEMSKLNAKRDISDLIRQLNENKNNQLSHEELKSMLEIENLIESRLYMAAKHKIDEVLKRDIPDDAKENYIMQKIRVLKFVDENKKAIDIIDSLISSDSYNLKYHFMKCDFLGRLSSKIDYLLEISKKIKYRYELKNRLVYHIIEYYESYEQELPYCSLGDALNIINQSLKLDPSLDNSAYSIKYNLVKILNLKQKQVSHESRKTNPIKTLDNNKNENKMETVTDILDAMKSVNSYHIEYLKLKKDDILEQKDVSATRSFIGFLKEIETSVNNDKRDAIVEDIAGIYYGYSIREYADNNFIQEASCFFEDNYVLYEKNVGFLINYARFCVSKKRDLSFAIDLCKKALDYDKEFESLSFIVSIFQYSSDPSDVNFIEKFVKSHEDKMKVSKFNLIMAGIEAFKKDYMSSLSFLKSYYELDKDKNEGYGIITYTMLKANLYNELISYVYENKDEINDVPSSKKMIVNINKIAANKFLKGGTLSEYDRSILNEFVSKKPDESVMVCAKSLLGEDEQALHHMKDMIARDYSYYYQFLEWPAINLNLKKCIEEHVRKNLALPLKTFA